MNMKHVVDKDGQLLGFVDVSKYSGMKFDEPWNVPEQAQLTERVGIQDQIDKTFSVTVLIPRKVEFREGQKYGESIIGLFVMEDPSATWIWDRDNFVKFEGFR